MVSVPLAKPPLAKYLGGTIPPILKPNLPNTLFKALVTVATGFVTIFFTADATLDTPVATALATVETVLATVFTTAVAGFVTAATTFAIG